MGFVKDPTASRQKVNETFTVCELVAVIAEPLRQRPVRPNNAGIDRRGQIPTRSHFIELFGALLDGRILFWNFSAQARPNKYSLMIWVVSTGPLK